MKYYKVIPLACSGKNNKVFQNGDIVTENNFPAGAIPDLISKGFLKPIETPEKHIAENLNPNGAASTETSTDESNVNAGDDNPNGTALGKTFDEWKVVEMREKLRELKIMFEPNANKKELFELLKKA